MLFTKNVGKYVKLVKGTVFEICFKKAWVRNKSKYGAHFYHILVRHRSLQLMKNIKL